MITDEEAHNIVCSAESQYLERKLSLPKGAELRQTLCAFANSTPEGQRSALVVGVRDDGEVVGVEADQVESFQQSILKVGREDCYPPVLLFTQVVEVKGKNVVIGIVPFSRNRPHFSGHAYIRRGPRSEKSSDAQFEELILQRNDKIRRILEAKRIGPVPVQLTTPANDQVHLFKAFARFNNKEYTVVDCDSFVLHLMAEGGLNIAIAMGFVGISRDMARGRLKLIIDVEAFDGSAES